MFSTKHLKNLNTNNSLNFNINSSLYGRRYVSYYLLTPKSLDFAGLNFCFSGYLGHKLTKLYQN